MGKFSNYTSGIPVQSDAKHSVISECGHEEINVSTIVTEGGQGSVVERDLTHPASITMSKGFGGRVSAPEAGTLGQDELEFRSCPTSDQRSDESQCVLVEVSLTKSKEKQKIRIVMKSDPALAEFSGLRVCGCICLIKTSLT